MNDQLVVTGFKNNPDAVSVHFMHDESKPTEAIVLYKLKRLGEWDKQATVQFPAVTFTDHRAAANFAMGLYVASFCAAFLDSMPDPSKFSMDDVVAVEKRVLVEGSER